MSEFWRQWENQVISGLFPLRRFLNASSHSAVFLTEYKAPYADAAIKFIRADTKLAQLQLARWRAAAALSHPHLIRLFEWGQCRLGDHELLFIVMEYAEQSLAQILPLRALTCDEVLDMLDPTLAALSFLHRNDWVHGQVKPSNVCVVDDVLKLASDTLRPAGESSLGTVEFSPYDAPEEIAGTSSSAGDIWGVGMTVVAALTRYPVARGNERTDIVLPENVAPAFASAVRRCLSLDPARRPSATELAAQLKPVDVGPSKAIPEPVRQSDGVRAAARKPLDKVSAAYILGGAILLAAAVGFGVHRMHGPANGRADVAPKAATAAAIPHGASAAGASAAGTEVPSHAVAGPASQPAAVASPAPGPVLHKEIPRVPRSALRTIQGRIKVAVRVTANDAGNVTDATLQYPGSSKYFARVAVESARAWRFAPATAPQPRKWLLTFEFTRAGAAANAAPVP